MPGRIFAIRIFDNVLEWCNTQYTLTMTYHPTNQVVLGSSCSPQFSNKTFRLANEGLVPARMPPIGVYGR
jgi:hypothetical protein